MGILIVIVIIVLVILFLIYASAEISSGVYIKTICRLDVNEKLLALTFDDGPDPDITPQMLDILAKYEIKAVFFCIGEQLKKNKSLIHRMRMEGHMIGNHTYSHSKKFPLFSVEEMEAEIQKCEAEIRSESGKETLSLFRPPFGVTNPSVSKALRKTGHSVLGWSIRSLDTLYRNPQTVIRRIKHKLKPGSIILLHDNRKNCPAITETIINIAMNEGYRFVRADEYIKS